MHLKPQHGHLYQKKDKRKKIREKENTNHQAVRSTSTTTTSEERRKGERASVRENAGHSITYAKKTTETTAS
jgi:hypothetical protein